MKLIYFSLINLFTAYSTEDDFNASAVKSLFAGHIKQKIQKDEEHTNQPNIMARAFKMPEPTVTITQEEFKNFKAALEILKRRAINHETMLEKMKKKQDLEQEELEAVAFMQRSGPSVQLPVVSKKQKKEKLQPKVDEEAVSIVSELFKNSKKNDEEAEDDVVVFQA